MGDAPVKLLFDTDIGTDIDDAVALAYLLSQPRCQLLGVTTVTGEPTRRAQLVSAIAAHAGRSDLPIFPGCPEPLIAAQRQTTAAQAAALGNWPHRTVFPVGEAIEFLRTTIRAHPGEVTLLATGPLTNLAVLRSADPQAFSQLARVVVMCGQFFPPSRGETNASIDPHATACLFAEGRNVRMPPTACYGLDVTTQCVLDADEVRRSFSSRVFEPVLDFAEVWFADRPEITFHDPLAAACVFEPDLCRMRPGLVEVSVTDDQHGWTFFEPGQGPHEVASEVDAEAFFEHFFEVVGADADADGA